MSSHLANLEHFRALRLPDARAEYERQLNDATIESLGFIDRLDLILDKEITMRHNRRVARKLREATLRVVAYKEEFSFETHRGISRETFAHLTSLSFMDRANGLIITGPTGVGKTYLGCALGMEAIRQEYSVRYVRTSDLIERLTLARADGSYRSLMANLRRLDLLILDDFGLSPVSVSSSRELLEIIDARVDLRSTIFLSQFPVAQFHALMEDKTAADAIMDRIIHASRVIELTGESMRKLKARDEPNQDEEGG
ncbi:IS21-like element helper ATPase IstB [Ferrimicrobium acidiphilum]|uniref:IS21-like element helper ATPase IstB n=4 Tax=Ferrimicrobium acidiphilum TaxID=121039 RepID=A0ABV3Y224_9ACTN